MNNQFKKINRKMSEFDLSDEQTRFFLDAILKHSRDAFYYFDIKSQQCTFISDSIETLSGYTPQEVLDQGVQILFDSLHPDDHDTVMDIYLGLINNTVSDSIINLEYRTRHKNGTYLWESQQINVLHDDSGNTKALVGTIKDITDQKLKEHEVKASQERFKRLAEATFEAIAIHKDGAVIDVNQQFVDLFGYTLDEAKKIHGLEMIASRSRDHVKKHIQSGYEGIYETFGKKKDGTIFPIQIQAKQAALDGKAVRIGAIRDLTEQKLLEDQKRDSEQMYQALFEGITAGIIVIDSEGRFLLGNQTACKDHDLSHEQLINSTLHDLYPTDAADRYLARIQRIIISGDSEIVHEQALIQGQQRWYQIAFFPLKNKAGIFDRVLVVVFDIHDKKMIEEKLEKSEKKYRELYDNAPVALYRTRISDGKIIMCNNVLAQMIGFDTVEECLETGFMTANSYVNPKRRQQLLDKLKKDKKVDGFEAEIRRKDGSAIWISITAELFGKQGYLEGTITDISVSKSLSKAEKRVLDIIMQGKSNKEIARQLGRSTRTIEDHRASIMRKLAVDNLVDLTKKTLAYRISNENE